MSKLLLLSLFFYNCTFCNGYILYHQGLALYTYFISPLEKRTVAVTKSVNGLQLAGIESQPLLELSVRSRVPHSRIQPHHFTLNNVAQGWFTL